MYIDAANNKILEPIDYLIKAEKKIKHLGLLLHLAELEELSIEANTLNGKILKALQDMPIETWETTSVSRRGITRDMVCGGSE